MLSQFGHVFYSFSSYGHLQAINRTHLYWTWENTHENVRPVMQDYLWIVQEHHGMRDPYQEECKVPNEEDIQI